MKKNCRSCHFLTKTHEQRPFSWNENEREGGTIKNSYAASCYMGVWDTGIDPALDKKLDEIINENREDSCFFIENRPGMNFKAAKILQKRKAANAQLKKSYRYTQWGLWIAVLALVSNVIINIIKTFSNNE